MQTPRQLASEAAPLRCASSLEFPYPYPSWTTYSTSIRSAYQLGVLLADAYEDMIDEIKRLHHELFWRGAVEAEAEYERREGRLYKSADALIVDLGVEKG